MKEYFTEISTDNIEYNLANLPQLVFEVTDACNLRCKYCGYADFYEGYDKRENLKFPFKRAKKLIDYLYTLWEKYYIPGCIRPITISFYGGEPLLNVPFIKEVIEYLESLPPVGKKYHYSMTTNGMLLDEYMDLLVEKQFHVLISLDGDEEGHGYRVDFAGKNSFQRVYKNIKLLKERYPLYFKKFVLFNSVLHKKNSVERIIDFVKSNFEKTPSIAPLNNSGIRHDKRDEFNQIYRNYNESIQEASNCESLKNEMFIKNPETNQLLKYLYYQSGNVFFNYNSLFINNENIQRSPTGTCTPFAKKMFVTVKGRILQCEKINHEFAVGLVTDDSVELNFKHIAKQHNDFVFKYVKQCKKCGNQFDCMQCIYQIDSIHDNDTSCLSFCTKKQKTEKNNQSLRFLANHPDLYKRLLDEIVVR